MDTVRSPREKSSDTVWQNKVALKTSDSLSSIKTAAAWGSAESIPGQTHKSRKQPRSWRNNVALKIFDWLSSVRTAATCGLPESSLGHVLTGVKQLWPSRNSVILKVLDWPEKHIPVQIPNKSRRAPNLEKQSCLEDVRLSQFRESCYYLRITRVSLAGSPLSDASLIHFALLWLYCWWSKFASFISPSLIIYPAPINCFSCAATDGRG